MGKFLMGLFFVIIVLTLVVELLGGTVPGINLVGKKIDDDIQEIYTGPVSKFNK